MADNQRDIVFKPLPELSWKPESQAQSLQEVATYVSNEAKSAISWYLAKKRWKRIGARLLRLGAILATAVAGLIPILAQMFTDENGAPKLDPAWASAALIVAATLVLLDRFFGYSTAWMRFLTTELQIRHGLLEFQLDWESRRAGWKDEKPTEVQVQEGLQACKSFLSRINGFLKEEMDAWIQEFRQALEEVDQAAKAQAEVMKLGAANVVVENGPDSVAGWQLSIDGGAPQSYAGKTAALRSLSPGSHTIAVTGIIGGQNVKAEKAFVVAGGSVVEIPVTLE